MNKKVLLIIILSLVFFILLVYFFIHKNLNKNALNPIQTESTPTSTPTKIQQRSFLAQPVADFNKRVTQKPFGIYVSPGHSPVSPERFTGYHTGADAEYGDASVDIPVYAVNDGVVTVAKTASGYGGVIMMTCEINGKKHSMLYGHIRPSTLPKIGQEFKKGDQIGVLGMGFTDETGGERKHLHFAVLSNDRVDIRGYVQDKTELSGWIDPLSLY